MHRSRFDDYIRRFNAQDAAAFDDYLLPEVCVLDGTLRLGGVSAMKAHHAAIWETFFAVTHIERYVADAHSVAVQMWTHLSARRDDSSTPFGCVGRGDRLDFRGLAMYRLDGARFSHICVAYNQFTHNGVHGRVAQRSLVHETGRRCQRDSSPCPTRHTT